MNIKIPIQSTFDTSDGGVSVRLDSDEAILEYEFCDGTQWHICKVTFSGVIKLECVSDHFISSDDVGLSDKILIYKDMKIRNTTANQYHVWFDHLGSLRVWAADCLVQ